MGAKSPRRLERTSFGLKVSKELHGCRHSIIPDRIEAGTYLAMAAAMGEGIKVRNVIYEHLESFIAKLQRNRR